MQLPAQHTVSPLMNAGMGLPINSQMANNPFLMGGMVNAQPAFNMGLPTHQGIRPPMQQQQQPQLLQQQPQQQMPNLMGSGFQTANFGASFNRMSGPIQQPNLSLMNTQLAGLQLADTSAGGLTKPQLNPTANGNGTLASNLWH